VDLKHVESYIERVTVAIEEKGDGDERDLEGKVLEVLETHFKDC